MALTGAACGPAKEAEQSPADTTVSVTYNPAKNVSEISSPLMKIAHDPPRILSVLIAGIGNPMSDVKLVSFGFMGDSALRSATGFDATLDGVTKHFSEVRRTPGGFPLAVDITLPEFREISGARSVSLSAGGQQFVLNSQQLSVIHRMAAEVP